MVSAMTLVDAASSPSAASPPRPGRLRRVTWSLAVLLLLASAGVTGATYYYDSVPAPAPAAVTYPVVRVDDLPAPVARAFVAAADPDFYGSGGSVLSTSPITRRYLVLATGSGVESSWRTRVMASKFEDAYSQSEILDGYLNRADYGRGAVGLVAAAQTYFQKPAARLTVAEAARLAVRLDPDRPAPEAGWRLVLDTMVDRGWLTPSERSALTFPG